MQCLICHKVVEETFCSLLNDNNKVCFCCLNKFKIRKENFRINEIEGYVLYFYDEFFKDLLFRYKGCYDYVLKDCFFVNREKEIRKKYKGYSIVLAPSNESSIQQRGFNHLKEIFERLKMPVIECFRKEKEWKQSDKKIKEREKIQNVIKCDKKALKGVKKVLLVDDVLTSGATIKAMIQQLPTNIDKKVLVLASNCNFLSNCFLKK